MSVQFKAHHRLVPRQTEVRDVPHRSPRLSSPIGFEPILVVELNNDSSLDFHGLAPEFCGRPLSGKTNDDRFWVGSRIQTETLPAI